MGTVCVWMKRPICSSPCRLFCKRQTECHNMILEKRNGPNALDGRPFLFKFSFLVHEFFIAISFFLPPASRSNITPLTPRSFRRVQDSFLSRCWRVSFTLRGGGNRKGEPEKKKCNNHWVLEARRPFLEHVSQSVACSSRMTTTSNCLMLYRFHWAFRKKNLTLNSHSNEWCRGAVLFPRPWTAGNCTITQRSWNSIRLWLEKTIS